MADVDATAATHVPLGSAAGSAGHGPDDEDERPEPLGEPDLRGWGAALMGGGIAVLVAIALFVATQA